MLGKVVAIDSKGETLISMIPDQDNTGCSSCSMGDSCGLPGSEEIRVKTSDLKEELSVNDTVDVEISSKKLIGLSASVYILPLITMLAGAIAMQGKSEPWVIVGALVGLSAGVFFNVLLNKALTMSSVVTVRRVG